MGWYFISFEIEIIRGASHYGKSLTVDHEIFNVIKLFQGYFLQMPCCSAIIHVDTLNALGTSVWHFVSIITHGCMLVFRGNSKEIRLFFECTYVP